MNSGRLRPALWLAMTAVLVLSACQPASAPAAASVTPAAPTVQPTPIPSPSPTPQPRSLVVCLGQEPTTLYPYGSSARSTWSVLEAVYDGPVDTRAFEAVPVILSDLPTAENGGAVLKKAAVQAGDVVVDASGEVTVLAAGVKVLPAGCRTPECAQVWDGAAPLEMDQLTLQFKLLPDLLWSDGTPLKAADSVYSYQLSADPATPVSKRAVNRTFTYSALDDLTVQWVGIPGELPAHLETRFWLPLPQHAWGQFAAADLPAQEAASRKPLGWGPYVVQEWAAGDHITLTRNPNYFRAAEGLPHFDTLVFRFLGQPLDNNLAALQAGECDLVDQTSLLDEQLEQVLEMQRDGKLKVYMGQGPDWEMLSLGILPAAYDDGYSPWGGDRADFFGDGRVRQALTYCLDRQGIVDSIFFGQTSVPAGYLPASHPWAAADLTTLPFDPARGSQLLDEAGWKDLDGDPATPRVALGLANVPEGTPLTLNYVTTQAPVRQAAAQKLVQSLAQCGVQVNVQTLGADALYAPGPEGVLFGRRFDLAQFSWDVGAQAAVCSLFESSQIPSAANHWLGVNVGGFSSPAYDAACGAARGVVVGLDAAAKDKLQAAERQFAQDLPVIPLYYRLKMAVSRPDLCQFDLDVSARSALWNLEALDFGETCPAQP